MIVDVSSFSKLTVSRTLKAYFVVGGKFILISDTRNQSCIRLSMIHIWASEPPSEFAVTMPKTIES